MNRRIAAVAAMLDALFSVQATDAQTTEINQPFITARMEGGTTTPLHLVETISRADLEKLVARINRILANNLITVPPSE